VKNYLIYFVYFARHLRQIDLNCQTNFNDDWIKRKRIKMKCLTREISLLINSLLVSLLLMVSMSAYSDVPQFISYSGQLADSGGTPIDTTVNLTFNLYEDADNNGVADGAAIWTETHDGANAVSVVDGLFSVAIGSVNGTLGSLKFDVPYLLGINVNGDGEMGLLSLASAPTSLLAEETQGSSASVDCTGTPTGGKIQAAIDAGATTITIDGVCNEAVSITRSGVSLVAEGAGDGIEGPSGDSAPALNIDGASNVVVNGLTITEATGSADESCVQVTSGTNVTFNSVSVEDCSDIGVQVQLNSSVIFSGIANSITATNVGLELVAGSSASITNMTISGFTEEGIAVIGSSFAYLGDEGAAGVTISATAVTATGIIIDGSSAVEMEGASISSTNGNGVTISGKSNLTGLSDGAANTITGGNSGIVVLSGSVQIDSTNVSISSIDANGTQT
jgi:hypothetical protein